MHKKENKGRQTGLGGGIRRIKDNCGRFESDEVGASFIHLARYVGTYVLENSSPNPAVGNIFK